MQIFHVADGGGTKIVQLNSATDLPATSVALRAILDQTTIWVLIRGWAGLCLIIALGCQQRTAPAIQQIPPATALTDLNQRPTIPSEIRVEQSATPQQKDSDWFLEITNRCGIKFDYHNGREGLRYTILETIGGGAAIFDFDNDDWPDLFLTAGGRIEGTAITGLPCALFRADRGKSYANVTEPAHVLNSSIYTLGCSTTDFDHDGFEDLCVTGYPGFHLHRNQGDGTYLETSVESVSTQSHLRAASAWGDFDNDGFPDLYVTGYVSFDPQDDRSCVNKVRGIRDSCPIWKYQPAPDQLFHNLGDGTFHESSKEAGLRTDGRGLGAIWADVNDDGHLDLYVANDSTANFLYVGDGRGHFLESGLISGTAYDENGAPQGSMGVDFGDYDGDGLGDLFVTNYELEDNTLYRNLGNTRFEVTTARTGLQNIGRPYVGFGTGWIDVDLDGWQDLFVLNGHIMYSTGQSAYEQPPFLFRSVDGIRFENISEQGGAYFRSVHAGRGGAIGDLDNDGAIDLVAVHHNSPVSVLKNCRIPTRWTRVCLHGTASESLAAGSVVTFSFQGRSCVRHIRGGGGYFSQFDRRLTLPADQRQFLECSVRWLNGRTEAFRRLRPCETNHLIEGQGEPL